MSKFDHDRRCFALIHYRDREFLGILLFIHEVEIEPLSEESQYNFEIRLGKGLTEANTLTCIPWDPAHRVTFLAARRQIKRIFRVKALRYKLTGSLPFFRISVKGPV